MSEQIADWMRALLFLAVILSVIAVHSLSKKQKNLIKNKLNIGMFNKIEKIYAILFVSSIFAGIIYGVINPEYFIPYEQAGRLDLQEGENNLTIFYKNFLVSAIDLVTAGIPSFYFNFVSFSTAASYLYSKGILYALVFVLLVFGILELLGSMLFGLIGLNFAQRIFKVKSNLNVKRLFIFGAILLFLASAIEYGFITILG